jgi:methyl-accepting chemotaxis protein
MTTISSFITRLPGAIRSLGMNRSIGRRLTTGFGVLLILITLVGLISSISVIAIETTLRDNLSGGFELHNQVTSALADILRAEQLEKDYLLRYAEMGLDAARNEYAVTFVSHIADALERLDAIEATETENDHSDIPETITSIRSALNAYRNGFMGVTRLLEQRGIDDEGKIGAFRATLAAIGQAVTPLDEPRLLAQVLIIQSREKEYLLTQATAQADLVRAGLDDLQTLLGPLDLAPEVIETLRGLADEYRTNFNVVVDTDAAMAQTIQNYRNAVEALEPLLGEIEAESLEHISEATNAIFDQISSSQGIVWLVIGVAFTAGLLMALVITRGITRPLGALTRVSQQVASGQLDQRVQITSGDEIGSLASAFNRMTDSLQAMFEAEQLGRARLEQNVARYVDFVQEVARGRLDLRLQVDQVGEATDENLHLLGENLNGMAESLGGLTRQIRDTALQVKTAAIEILGATNQQLASAAEQDAAVTQTIATVEEVQATVAQTAERAQDVAEAAQQSLKTSAAGQDSVEDTIQGMHTIQTQVEAIAENILALSERTQQIGDIIETVNDIADQSKLLALNASIEAARAGEEGRGFAVVAMEVRQLAEQSRQATARIRTILEEIQQATNTAVMVTEEGNKSAASGMALVDRTGHAIGILADTIETAAQAATQIAASTGQQNTGMRQLLNAMAAIKQAAAQTVTSTRQAEVSARGLSDVAKQMEEIVALYQL